ncbi:MAG: cadherin-like domain-containing protein [Hormoscilla sp. GM7CHS1pb]|nr:cadherin-like domain-containing protein [Hormoscilla sp. GM7CHS1pb]
MALILDIDGNGTLDALTDGRLVLLYLLEQLNETAVASSLGQDATRTTLAEIEAYLDSIRDLLDIDGNGTVDALSDGVLNVADQLEVLEAVIQTALGEGATRTTPEQIGAYLDSLENEPPVAADDQAIVGQEAEISIPVLGNDSGNPLTITETTDPANGSVTISGDQVVYTSDPGFTGTDSFTYSISNGAATSSATVTVTVQPAEGPLTGTDGADVLIGNNNFTSLGAAPEQIIGGAGDDTLVGGRGADRLTGGEGADRFEYLSLADSGADPDRTLEPGDNIQDFAPTVDTIALLFDVAPGTPVTPEDVTINLIFINLGLATIGLSALNTEDNQFLPEQFTIRLNNLDPATTAENILGAIVFA